jgi:L-threonylcarbamoyladenylate synthase
MASTEVIKITDPSQIPAAAEAAADALRAGKLVGFPTETVYGIAVDATNAGSMQRLRELKDRPANPFSVHLGRPEDLQRYIRKMPPAAARLVRSTWPGPVTLLLETGGHLADKTLDTPDMRAALTSGDVIGLRCPDEPVSAAMLSAVDGPVLAPSANLAGEPSPRSGDEVLASLDGKIDLLIDHGPTTCGADSTIVRFTGLRWEVVRSGAVSDDKLREAMRFRLIVVCTGNTCRSPMAEGLARQLVAERVGCSVDELEGQGIEIISAGVFAASGSPATPEAQAAAARLGADISSHRSRKLSTELIKSADMILCMTQSHLDSVCRMQASAAGTARLLDGDGDVPDPIGGGIDMYDSTADHLQQILPSVLEGHIL